MKKQQRQRLGKVILFFILVLIGGTIVFCFGESVPDLPTPKKILDEKVSDYVDMVKDASFPISSTQCISNLMFTVPKSVLVLRIDQDGDIFLRGKWIGWDGRLKNVFSREWHGSHMSQEEYEDLAEDAARETDKKFEKQERELGIRK